MPALPLWSQLLYTPKSPLQGVRKQVMGNGIIGPLPILCLVPSIRPGERASAQPAISKFLQGLRKPTRTGWAKKSSDIYAVMS